MWPFRGQGHLFIYGGLPPYYCPVFVCTAIEQLYCLVNILYSPPQLYCHAGNPHESHLILDHNVSIRLFSAQLIFYRNSYIYSIEEGEEIFLNWIRIKLSLFSIYLNAGLSVFYIRVPYPRYIA